jgi:hypothetical protein
VTLDQIFQNFRNLLPTGTSRIDSVTLLPGLVYAHKLFRTGLEVLRRSSRTLRPPGGEKRVDIPNQKNWLCMSRQADGYVLHSRFP